jgi:LacI family transcriptional regulator
MLVGAERAHETTTLLKGAGIPVVLTWCSDGFFSSVTIDNDLAGRLAAQHLIDLGHRRIGMITGHLHFNDRQRARLAGATAALIEAGLCLPQQLVTEQALTMAGGRAGCATLLELDDRPTALIGGVDLFAIGCIEEAHARGIDVPSNLSVIGIDGLDMSAHISPSLTTVNVPTAKIGQETATKLIALIQRDGVEASTQLPVELIVRRSTAVRRQTGPNTR